MCILSVFIFIVACSARREHFPKKVDLKIGGLFERNANFSEKAFTFAADWINEKKLLPQFNLFVETQEVDMFDSYKVSLKVCEMMSKGVAGIFGPHSVDTSDHVQSVCDAMEIPHIEMRWDSRQRRGSCSVNLYPHPSTLTKVFVDIVKAYEWKSFTLLYEDNEGLIRLNGLLTYYDHRGFPVTVRQLDESGNYRPTLRRIKNSNQKNIVIDCSVDVLYNVLLHAQQVGLVGAEYSYIITTLDFQTINWEPFMYAGTNITGVRFVDPSSTDVQEVLEFWEEKHQYQFGSNFIYSPEKLNVETALIHDAVLLYTKAVDQLLKSKDIELKSLDCEKNDYWEHGFSIINFMKVSEVIGLTGLIKFNHEGFRTDFKLDIIEITAEGMMKKGSWNITEGINFTQTMESTNEIEITQDLRNTSFVVMISLIDPHAMFKETTDKLEGNDKYEGMGIDVIHELSLILGFNYTFREQKEGGSGNPDPVTGKWDGMIGEVMSKRADLAIADITITEEREKDVDFTLPYMTLGISILYKKPTKTPSLFSFMSPFSNNLWKALIAAYVGVSVLMYVIARISPKEWTNPNPCVNEEDLDELENQFSLNNSFWFVTGCIMQQGSELAPISASTRLLASVWAFFTLIIVSSYTANLAAFLTVEQNVEIFRNVEELANQKPNSPNFVKYGAKVAGATESFFKLSNHSTYQKMWHYMQEHYADVMMNSNKEGVDRVLSDTEEYAFLMESASIDYEVQRKCTLRQVGNPLDNKGYGIVMRKKEWYRNLLSSTVIKLQEKGKFMTLYKKWWKEKRGGGACDGADSGGGEADPLDLDNVGGVFLVLVFGSAFAGLLSISELMYQIYVKEPRDSFWQELKKELKFVVSCKESVKQLKSLSNEDLSQDENTDNQRSFFGM